MDDKALSTMVDWSSVENQSDLDRLVESIYWSDAGVVAFVGNTDEPQAFFPTDVARSGHQNWNIRVLVQIEATTGRHLEIVLIDCDEFSSVLFANFSLRGRVDSLKRVEVSGLNNQRILRCSRLLYRFLSIDQIDARNHYGFEAP
jgi:hypothetical protein